jgi:Tfp pilus assembly protein PilX
MKNSLEKHNTGYGKQHERGIALLTALLFLLLISALAVGMMYMSSTDASINSNFRAEQQAYFAARAGMEEMRDRMRTSSANTITTTPGLPTAMPGLASNSVIYLINQGTDSTTIQPWDKTNKYYDTELCHDGFSTFSETNSGSADVQCSGSSLGSLASNYKAITSVLPFADKSAAIPFKWARLTLKQANSVLGHPVDPKNTSKTTPVCYNGTYEKDKDVSIADCPSMDKGNTPVYMITALAVTNSGSRRMVQAEVAQQPSSSTNFGLFATGTGCGAITMGGNNNVDAYDSSTGYSPSTANHTDGAVGSNGNVSASGTVTIGGNVYSPVVPSVAGKCSGTGASTPFTTNGGNAFYPGTSDTILPIATQSPLTPTIPADGTVNIDDKYLKANAKTVSLPSPASGTGYSLSPGKYNDISISSSTALVLQSGTYNINTLTETGSATLYITGPVVLNITGSGGGTVVKLTGGGFVNTTNTPSNFQINYAGTGEMDINGGQSASLLVDAPNGYVKLGGNSDYYGAILANTIALGGGANFHYDEKTKLPLPVPTYYTLLSFRELYY